MARLLVVHSRADRTAETVGLVELLRALVATGERDVRVLLMAGGPLLEEIEALAPTIVVADLDPRSPDGMRERLAFALRRRSAGFRIRARRLGLDRWDAGDAVYLHTVLGVQVLRYLPDGVPTVLCRLAEDVHPLDHPLGAADLELLLRRVDHFLPVTSLLRDELVEVRRVAPARVHKVPELFVPPDDRLPDSAPERERLRAELGIGADALVVGSFGTSEADAPDLGVLLWSMLAKRATERPVELLWGAAQTEAGFWMGHDLRATGLEAGTHAVPADADLAPYLELCDVLVLLTRVDDYPFAYLERAAAGVPVLCFEGNGLADLAGLGDPRNVAPYLDVVGVAEQVTRLLGGDDALASRQAAMAAAAASVHGPGPVARRVLDLLAEVGS